MPASVSAEAQPLQSPEDNPQADLVDLQRTLYDSSNPTRRWLHRARRDRVSQELRLAALGGAGARALEVGPGAGPYIGLMCDLFAEVVATDIQAVFLDHVGAKHGSRANLTLIEDDIAQSRLPAGGFDVILCSEVIEHTPDPETVLRGIARLLRPGGTLILSTPQSYSPLELLGRIAFWPGLIQIVRLIYREPVLPTHHISLLTRRRLRLMLAAAGLRITAGSLTGLYLPVLAEVGGERALRLQQRLAARLEHGPLSGLLWTQHWTAERAL